MKTLKLKTKKKKIKLKVFGFKMFLIGYKIVTCAYCEAKTPIN